MDSEISQLKNCRRSCNRMEKSWLSMLLSWSPFKDQAWNPPVISWWQNLNREPRERSSKCVTFLWVQSQALTHGVHIHQAKVGPSTQLLTIAFCQLWSQPSWLKGLLGIFRGTSSQFPACWMMNCNQNGQSTTTVPLQGRITLTLNYYSLLKEILSWSHETCFS